MQINGIIYLLSGKCQKYSILVSHFTGTTIYCLPRVIHTKYIFVQMFEID